MAGFLLATCGISSLNARQYVSFRETPWNLSLPHLFYLA